MKKIFSKKFNPSYLGRSAKWKKDIADEQKRLSKLQKPFTKKIDACPICKSNESTFFCEIFSYFYKECSYCGHIFSESVLPQENLESYYSSLEDIKSVQTDIYLDKKIFLKRVKQIADPKVDFVIKYANLDNPNNLWVDIGAGPGEIVFSAKNKGLNCIGYEIDAEAVMFAKDMGINVEKSTINENFDFNIFKTVGLISLMNVLEHIENPKSFLFKISKNTKVGSYLLIEVPRTPSLSSYINKLFPDYSNRHIYPPDHLHIFSDESLKLIV